MFETIKNKMKRDKLIRLFLLAVAALDSVPGYIFLSEKDADELAAAVNVDGKSLIAINKAVTDANKNVAVAALAVGGAKEAAATLTPAAPKAAAPAPGSFALETGIAIPESKRGGVRVEVYPFEQMTVGQSFFVAATADRPNPAKSLQSTVSSATRRYAKKLTNEDGTAKMVTKKHRGKDVTQQATEITRKFLVREVKEDGKITGARVWRSQ